MFAAGVVLLFLAFTLQSFRIAKRAPDQFGRLLATGIATWIGFQAFVNIGAMLSLLPLTGIPLPLISYGSSSMIMIFAAVGVLANISRRTT
jgi:cell division protein FtsW